MRSKHKSNISSKDFQKKYRKIIHTPTYKEITLLPNYLRKGYFQYRLDQILMFFEFADSCKHIIPVFIRLNFDKIWSPEQIYFFFKSATKLHRRKNRFFLYYCIMEEDDLAYGHYHAFLILDKNDYERRKNAIEMITKIASLTIEKFNCYCHKYPFITKRKQKNHPKNDNLKKYNFYIISSDNEHYHERQAALTAASYLAKTEQFPKYAKPDNFRSVFKSNIPTRSKLLLK